MATYTSNINLKKPAQSDKIRIADFNGNADNIDAAIGADFGQGTKPSINQAINSLADGLAIIANGNVHAAITAGQFVYVRNHDTLSEGLYVASSNISANGTLSGSNLTADGSGGLNALNSKIVEFHKKTITGTTTVSGAISADLNMTSWEIISVRCTSQTALAFHRGDGYIMMKKADDLSAIASTSVTIDIVYAWKNSIPS